MVLKFFWNGIIGVIIWAATEVAAASTLGSLERLDLTQPGGLSPSTIPLVSVYEGKVVDVLYFSDLPLAARKSKLQQIGRFFDDFIYPRFVSKLVPDPKGPQRSENKIQLVVDDIKDPRYPALFFKALVEKSGRDIILISTSALDNHQLKYYLVHELEHAIRYLYNPTEAHWLDEALAKFAECVVFETFPILQADIFLKNPSHALNHSFEDPQSWNYFNGLLFLNYLNESFGQEGGREYRIDLVRALMTSSVSGIKSIDFVLAQHRARSKDPFKAHFFAFNNAFFQYSIALLANRYRSRIDSGGLLEIHFPYGFDSRSFSVENEFVERDVVVEAESLSSRYFKLETRCFEISSPTRDIYAVIFEPLSSDKKNRIRLAKDSQKECFEASENTHNYLIIINTNPGIGRSLGIRLNY